MRDAMALGKMKSARVLAGSDGRDRRVRWVHILDIPDIVPWVSAGDLVLTNGFGFATNPESMDHLVERLDDKGVAGLMVGMGLFIRELPDAMLAEAEARRFPIIQIPWRVRFEDLTLELIQAILGTQSSLLDRVHLVSQGLLEAALSNGFDKMAGTLSEALGEATVVVDRWGAALGGSPPTFLRLASENQGIIKEKLDECAHRLNVRDGLGAVLTLKRQRMSIRPVVVGNRLLGAILLGSARDQGPSNRLIITVASTVVALELMRLEESFRGAYTRRQEFLSELIRGSVASMGYVEARAEFLGWPVGHPFVLSVLEIDEFARRFGELREGQGALEDARRAILELSLRHLPGPEVFLAEHTGSLTVILEAGSNEEAAKLLEPLRDRLKEHFDGSDVTVGLAGPSRNFLEVPRLHGQAWESIRIARKMGRRGEMVPFDDVRIEHLLLRLDDRESAALTIVPELQRLLAYDQRHGGDLFRTLDAYLQSWGNVEVLARDLHIHRNTVRYRVRKIEELLGRSLLDSDYRFSLHVATKLTHLES